MHDYGDVRYFLVNGRYSGELNKDQKRALRKKAAAFLVIDDRLHHKGSNGKVQKASYLFFTNLTEFLLNDFFHTYMFTPITIGLQCLLEYMSIVCVY